MKKIHARAATYPSTPIAARMLYRSPLVNFACIPAAVPLTDRPHRRKIVRLSLLTHLYGHRVAGPVPKNGPLLLISLKCRFVKHLERIPCIVRAIRSCGSSRYISGALSSCAQIERTRSPMRIRSRPAVYVGGRRVEP